MDTFKMDDIEDDRIKIIDYEDEDIEVEKRELQQEPQTPANQRISTVVLEQPRTRTSILHLPREVQMLHMSYNNIYENLDSAFYIQDQLEEDVEHGKVDATYEEVTTGPDAEHWKKAIQEEIDKWKQREVFKTVKIDDVPKNKRLIGSRWVLECRKDGQFQARIVAQGSPKYRVLILNICMHR